MQLRCPNILWQVFQARTSCHEESGKSVTGKGVSSMGLWTLLLLKYFSVSSLVLLLRIRGLGVGVCPWAMLFIAVDQERQRVVGDF